MRGPFSSRGKLILWNRQLERVTGELNEVAAGCDAGCDGPACEALASGVSSLDSEERVDDEDTVRRRICTTGGGGAR